MLELREAAQVEPKKTIVILLIEKDANQWINKECRDLCQFDTSKIFDLSELTTQFRLLGADEGENFSERLMQELYFALDPLQIFLKQVGCDPSLAGPSLSMSKC
jgi:hypothetical protein